MNTKKTLKNFIIFILLILITYYVIFRNINIIDLKNALNNCNIKYIIIAILIIPLYILTESLNHKRTLTLLNEDISYTKCIKYSIIGFFYSAITPAAIGGQPFQIYYMRKDKIKTSNAAISVFIQTSSYLIINVLLGILGYIFFFKYINSLNYFLIFLLVGIIANTAIIAFTLTLLFNKKLALKLFNLEYKIIKKFKPEKLDEIKEKNETSLEEYHRDSKFITKNKSVVIKSLLTNLVELVSMNCIPFFIFKSLGVNNMSFIKTTLLQSVLHLSASTVPLPGTIGVSETGFSIIYKTLIGSNLVGASMLLTRTISFYSLVFITGFIYLIVNFKYNKK